MRLVLRFAILAMEAALPRWLLESARLLQQDGHVLVAVVAGVDPAPAVAGCFGGVPLLVPTNPHSIWPSGHADLSSIDFVLVHGAPQRIPPAARACPLGAWTWRFGALDGSQEKDLGRTELAAGETTIEARLLCWSATASPPRELHRGRFLLAGHSLGVTRQRVIEGCRGWPRRITRELEVDGPSLRRYPLWPVPATTSPAGSGLLAAFRARLRGLLRKLSWELLLEEKWTIGVLNRPLHSLLERPDVSDADWWPPLPGTDFLADPIGLPDRPGRALAERFDASLGRGVLAVLDLERRQPGVTVLETACHQSFPLLTSTDGAIHCVPERSAAGRVEVFELEEFPSRWRRIAVPLPDVAGVDCVLFRHEGLWWLLGGDAHDQDQVKLFAWYGPALDGPWKGHRLNPIKTDAAGARSAGPVFRRGANLYRPAQDCSCHYGGAVVIHRILELSPTQFREEPVARVAPDPNGPWPHGLHTVSPCGDLTLIDGKWHRYSWRKAVRVLAARLRPRRTRVASGSRSAASA